MKLWHLSTQWLLRSSRDEESLAMTVTSPHESLPATGRRKLPNVAWRLAAAGVMLAGLTGCSRAFWRQQADRDAYEAISERMTDFRWQLPRFDVTPHPESRFYDPYDPDKGPLPPDDPAAHAYMHCSDGIGGYKSWHNLGDSFCVENPQWLNKYGLSAEMINPVTGDYTGRMPALQKLKLSDCVELSQIHSRELQTQVENMYLAALDVSFERFQFGVRYLGVGGGEPSLGLNNTFIPHGTGDSSGLNSRFGVRKLLPAGGQIAAELANNTLWLFSGPNQTNSASVLSFSLVQPLINGAGRKVVMENLTQAERDLLYQTRSLARFRQSLFTNIVSDGSGSYLSLIQQIQGIRNQEENIERLKRQVAQLQSNSGQKGKFASADLDKWLPGVAIPQPLELSLVYNDKRKLLLWVGPMSAEEEAQVLQFGENLVPGQDGTQEEVNTLRLALKELIQAIRVTPTPLDVLQLQGSLANSINQLRSQERGFQDGLDSLKLGLGLPTDIQLTIDDSMLGPFAVIDPQLKSLEQAVMDFIIPWGEIDEEDPTTEQLQQVNARFVELIHQVEAEGFAVLDQDVQNLNSKLESRLADLENEEDRRRVQSDIARDMRLLEDARARLEELKQSTTELANSIHSPAAQKPADRAAPPPIPEGEVSDELELPADQMLRLTMRDEILQGQQRLLQIARNLSVVEIGLRVEQIEIPDFGLDMSYVVEFAVENRVDLMNEKASVTDARRKVEIAANRLQTGLNVVVEGDVRNSGGNKPFDFRGNRSQIRAGVQVTAPLDQMNDRNNYRASLITYQRARRDFMLLEDTVKNQVRRNWRQLAVLKRNLETSRLQLRLAARQYEAAVDDATAPAAVNTGGGGGSGRSGLAGNNLLQALNSIVSAQNSLIQNWVAYEQNRLSIYRDMGMMEIGEDGIWNDPQYRNLIDTDTPEERPVPPILPEMGPDNDNQ
ncbi:MAG: hypothetical protein DWH91_06080 [Planctomycetota bacterium]|nr:MAG: hypothetical protein DWH91_06080 [Planctomycetota bacterium]